MALTKPKASQIDFDVTNITDPLIRLNSGETGSADKDVGWINERGDDQNRGVIWDESADEFALINTTETGTTGGNVTIAGYAGLHTGAIATVGSIIPDADDTYDLGSASYTWRDVYVGPGSLYVNGKKVLEDDSGTITISTTVDQGLTVKTTGTGVTTVQSAAGLALTTTSSADITLTTSTGNIEMKGNIELLTGKKISDSASTKVEFGDDIDMNSNAISEVSTLTATTVAGTLSTAAQTNITSVGTLGSLTVTGAITVGGIVGSAATGALEIPVGTTAQRPGSPATGGIRYNSTTSRFEGYNGSAWVNIDTLYS